MVSIILRVIFYAVFVWGMTAVAAGETPVNKFEPLSTLNAPNMYRLADGRPGPDYWQQSIAYSIDARLDVDRKQISARGELVYRNNSPVALNEIWLELALNAITRDARSNRSAVANKSSLSTYDLQQRRSTEEGVGGIRVLSVKTANDKELPTTLNETTLRVDLESPIKPGEHRAFTLEWRSTLVDVDKQNVRVGYSDRENEPLIFHVAQWYPQPIAYTDYAGWRNTPFIYTGEFVPEFGDFSVSLSVPEGVIVAATGELTNSENVLTEQMQSRMKDLPVGVPRDIVTMEEARQASIGQNLKTWKFRAEQVRDFAFAASTGYIWEAMKARTDDGSTTTIMSFYPENAAPLWRTFSMEAIAHTMKVYSRQLFPYPYPTLQAAYGPVDGMEHSMLTFSAYAPDGPDGKSYSRQMKQWFLWVLVHEVGHSWFPLIVNSDERAWTWMDEGLNSFMEQLTMLEWSNDYVRRENSPRMLGSYREANSVEPPMTPANAVRHLFPSQYNRPAAALIILRELILGRERFDHAFQSYAREWKFKRPTPTDFFRSMNQATGEDLSWFWRSWFYTTDHVDLSVSSFVEIEPIAEAGSLSTPESSYVYSVEDLTVARNDREGKLQLIRQKPEIADIYDRTLPIIPEAKPVSEQDVLAEQEVLDKLIQGGAFYIITVDNLGGIISPLPFEIVYQDGSSEHLNVPVEVWFEDQANASHIMFRTKEIKHISLDPDYITGDLFTKNNGHRIAPTLEKVAISVSPDLREFRE